MKSRYQYVNLLKFGDAVVTPSPDFFSTFSGAQNKIMNDVTGFNLGPETFRSQVYNAQKAAANFNDPGVQFFLFPELFPKFITQYPAQNTPNLGSPYRPISSQSMDFNYGDYMLENAVMYRYGEFLGLNGKYTDNMIGAAPDSAINTIPVSKGIRIVVDPTTIDTCPLVNELIRRYFAKGLGEKVLLNIYNTAKTTGVDISQTKVGRVGAAITKVLSC